MSHSYESSLKWVNFRNVAKNRNRYKMRSLSKYIALLAGTNSESSLRNDDVIQIENVFKTGNGDIAFNYIKNEHSYIGFHDSQQRNGYTSGPFSFNFRSISTPFSMFLNAYFLGTVKFRLICPTQRTISELVNFRSFSASLPVNILPHVWQLLNNWDNLSLRFNCFNYYY